MTKNIAVFASGTGSNAKKIIDHFKHHPRINVCLLVCNRPGAKVLEMAEEEGVPTLLINRNEFYKEKRILKKFKIYSVDFVVLAGFLWLVPGYLVKSYENRMINIHPALLPRYGGKGMYGMNVHRAVKESADRESGITIHYVNEQYDDGDIVFQKACSLSDTDTPETIAKKVQQLEHRYFPVVIENLIAGNNTPAR
ncbi:MAG TPA: phosphoribosylglycinamide formyltransferase [Bacteroidetes bacterium]|nr:phosphoribosylglycinamide formyltransferase [Bacteroidota bacterium]